MLAQHLVTRENAQTFAASFNRVVALLSDRAATPGPGAARPPGPLPPAQRPPPAVAAVLPPDAEVLNLALRLVLEQAPHYWRVLGAEADAAALDAAQVVVADVSDGDPGVLMRLGYLRWTPAGATRPLVLLQREGTHLSAPALDSAVRVSYAAPTAETADLAGAQVLAATLGAQLAALPALAALQATARVHALSDLVLHRQFGVDSPLASGIAARYATMEAFIATSIDTLVETIPGLSRTLARGLQSEFADVLRRR